MKNDISGGKLAATLKRESKEKGREGATKTELCQLTRLLSLFHRNRHHVKNKKF